jgi:hypothetical protein
MATTTKRTGCAASKFTHAGVHSALCNCLDPVCADCGCEDRERLSLVAPALWLCGMCEERREQRDAELRAGAYASCYGCLGTGRLVGFGSRGEPCPCVARCFACDEVIVWAHDDERAPKFCAACLATETEPTIEPAPLSFIPKACGCGCTYATRCAWTELTFVGMLDDIDDDGGRAEMRNCVSCNSTLAIEVRA